jgi:hypothetical protein
MKRPAWYIALYAVRCTPVGTLGYMYVASAVQTPDLDTAHACYVLQSHATCETKLQMGKNGELRTVWRVGATRPEPGDPATTVLVLSGCSNCLVRAPSFTVHPSYLDISYSCSARRPSSLSLSPFVHPACCAVCRARVWYGYGLGFI